jgi:hypothetical protein
MARLTAAESAAIDAAVANAGVALQALRDVPWERKNKAMLVLLELIVNLERHPDNCKFRCLKEVNKKLSADLFGVPGCLDVLHAVGFQSYRSQLILFDSGDELVLTKHGLGSAALSIIEQTRQKLEEFVKEETMSQQRKERDERIAKAKEEEANFARGFRGAKRKVSDPVPRAPPVKTSGATVMLQSVGSCTPVIVPLEATVGLLRARVAEFKRCEPHQVRLAHASSGELLRYDHEKLEGCGISDNSEVVYSVGAMDEIQVTNEHAVQRLGPGVAKQFVDLDTWTYTRRYLETAIARGLPADRARTLKRDLHFGALTCKEIRQMISQEMQVITGEATPLADVDDKYARAQQKVSSVLTKLEKDRAYSEEIARDNAKGLRSACASAYSGSTSRLPTTTELFSMHAF